MWEHWLKPGWGHAFRLMVGEMSVEFPALFRAWAREGPLQGSLLVRQLIEDGIRQGEFRPDADADVSARLVVSGLCCKRRFTLTWAWMSWHPATSTGSSIRPWTCSFTGLR